MIITDIIFKREYEEVDITSFSSVAFGGTIPMRTNFTGEIKVRFTSTEDIESLRNLLGKRVQITEEPHRMELANNTIPIPVRKFNSAIGELNILEE
jgi:hypothetical protein